MKKSYTILSVVVVFGLALVLCGSGCDEDGNGGAQVRSLEEARAIADPIGNAWNPDAFNWVVNGIYVDDKGLLYLYEPEVSFWQFRYWAGGNVDYVVSVYDDGSHIEWEFQWPEETVFYELPSYDDDHIEFLMGIATNELYGYLGEGNYMYQLGLVGDEEIHTAQVYAHPAGVPEQLLAWVILDADTGEVLFRSWAP